MATLPDYSINVAQPFTEALKGYQLGMGFEAAKQQNIMQQQQAQQALRQQQALQNAQRLVFQNPNAENYSKLMTLDPKSSEAYQRAWSTRNAQQQETLAADLLKQGAAITSGKPEIAAQYLEDKATAIEAQNNGQPTPESQAVRTQARMMKEHPEFALGQIQALLAVNPLGKQASETLSKFGEESRAAAKAPMDLAEAEAKAIQEGVKAEFARPVAMAELAKTKAETLAPSVRESIDFANLQPEQQKTFQSLQILKKPPAAVTNVNVSNVDKTAAAELGKLVPDLYNQANSAATQLSDLPRYQAALDNAITGPFAEQRLSTARVASALGFTGDKAVNATREVIQGLSEMALKSRTMLTGQGQITEGEQKLLIKARSGDINFTKGELKTIFGVADRAAKAQYNQSRKLLESAAKQSPTAQMFLENMQPLATQEAPKPAPAQAMPAAAVPGMPAGFRVIR
jgi:hypothetical protein